MMLSVIVAIFVCLIVYIYRSLKPPPPRICGVSHGPPVTSPRIRLSDGRYLAYRESGVDKANANYKIIVVHGFNSSKDMEFSISKVHFELLFLFSVILLSSRMSHVPFYDYILLVFRFLFTCAWYDVFFCLYRFHFLCYLKQTRFVTSRNFLWGYFTQKDWIFSTF